MGDLRVAKTNAEDKTHENKMLKKEVKRLEDRVRKRLKFYISTVNKFNDVFVARARCRGGEGAAED